MAYFFMSNTVMAYQRFRHMGCCQNTPQRMLLFQVSRRTDTGKHRCIHITQKESHILLLHGKTRRQLHCCRGFTRSRTSPDCQHLILIFRFPVRRAVPGSPAENTVFRKFKAYSTSLSSVSPCSDSSCSSALVSSGSLSE